MSIRKIVTEPDPILKQISKNVDQVGKEEQKLMDDMLETMYKADGIGLAAVQVGVLKRIIVMDIAKKDKSKILSFTFSVSLWRSCSSCVCPGVAKLFNAYFTSL